MEGELLGEVEASFDDGNLVVDMDAGDDFFFSEDPFASIPNDFSCFSTLPPQPPTETFSPSTTTFKPKGSILSSSSSTASSSSSASWSSFLQAPEVAAASDNAAMVEPTSFLDRPQGEFSDDISFFTNFEGLLDLEDSCPDLPGSTSEGGDAAGACGGGRQEAGGEGEEKGKEAGGFSDDLAKVFFEWLRSNKESISPEDLRSIRLNRSTIESAACRLGRNKQGRIQLLKLILAWVQHNHLRRNRLNPLAAPPHPPPVDYQPMQSPPYIHQLDYNYGSNWFPGADMMAYGGDMFSGATAPYPYHHYGGGGGGGGHLAGPVLSQFAPFPGAGMVGGFLPMFPQGQGMLRGTTTAVSKTEEARRKRMARQQRRLASLHHYHHHQRHHRGQRQHAQHSPEVSTAGASSNPSTARNWDFWTNMAETRSTSSNTHLMQSLIGDQVPPLLKKTPQVDGAVSSSLKRPGLKGEKNLKFLLQKVLKQSDVGSLGRIVLPKKEAEMHLPELDARDGISIAMEDIGTSQVWNMRYRFWPNNKSRMYLLENTGDFVRCNGLQEGDFIVIYSDVKSGKYLIRGVKVRQSLEPSRSSVKAGQHHKRS
ncbi:LOW QUALITY PROTEIN: regulatory protein viviparous-1-like [Curcuma longa]|uniref:LOW QUALITY PROTEIN: regulatory protein viviparous-1-like n=1 Tax=Curcuma longa TaxID=136217 RepID=UPI003D9E4E76